MQQSKIQHKYKMGVLNLVATPVHKVTKLLPV